jgi:ribonuclease Z
MSWTLFRAPARGVLPDSLACALVLLLVPASSQAQTLKVTLLGTGSPPPEIDRFGPSTLVEAGTERLVLDAGRGASQRLAQLGIRLGQVNALFLTHLHSDHVVGIPDLWLHRWVGLSGPGAPLEVFGPSGTREMMAFLGQAYQADVRQREEPGARARPANFTVIAHDAVQGVVYERNGVTVTAFDVDHGEPKMPAFGYRIDYAGRSVVISGDTRPSDNLVRFARGTDVLIHEVMAARPQALSRSEALRRTVGSHTTPEDAGTVFARVKPRLAVYTHVSLMAAARSAIAELAASIVPRTRSTYAGPLEVGEDLMAIEIGETIEVRRLATAR